MGALALRCYFKPNEHNRTAFLSITIDAIDEFMQHLSRPTPTFWVRKAQR